jgi:hypothetical protein
VSFTVHTTAEDKTRCDICDEVIEVGDDVLLEHSSIMRTICTLCEFDGYKDYDETEEKW